MSEQGKKNILVNFCTAVLISVIIAVLCKDMCYNTNDIYVTFNAKNEKEVAYQAFYTEGAKDSFNGEQSVKLNVPAGQHQVRIVLPAKKIARFRLDFGVRPGTVYISDLKIFGDKIVNFNNFSKYKYSQYVDNHSVTKDGSLKIVSNQGDPYMVTTEKLNILPETNYDFGKMLLIFGGSFVVAFLLAMLLNRKQEATTKKD